MVGRDVLRRRLAVLQDALADLRRYRSRFDASALRSDRDAQHMVLHAMYIAAQAAIDVALHAASAAEQPEATTYQQAFEHLALAGLLERDLANHMMGWAGLRNILAHQYATIDYGRIAATLATELDQLDEFVRVASSWK